MSTNKPAKTYHLRTVVLFALMFAAIPIIDSSVTHQTYATNPPPVCQNLTAVQSDDKNYYNLAVTATAAKDSDINGYQFDFGDHESYTFNFDNKSNQNRRQATVKHTYEKAGKYLVSARVVSAKNGDAPQTSSNSCTANITIAGVADTLPATGPNIWITLAVAGFIGLGVYVITLEGMRKTSKF